MVFQTLNNLLAYELHIIHCNIAGLPIRKRLVVTQKDYGVLWGSGGSFLFFSGVSILRFYFNRNLSFANGVTMTGAGFGTLIFNIMLQELDSKYGWRGGMRFLSVFAALTFLSGCAYIPPPVDYSAFERPSLLSRLKMIVDPRPWRDRAFPMWVLSLSFILFAYFFPYTYLVSNRLCITCYTQMLVISL